MASVTALLGKLSAPLTYRLVVVTFVVLMFAGLNEVAAKVVKKPLVEVTEVKVRAVPVEVVKVRPVVLTLVEVTLDRKSTRLNSSH